MVTPELDIRLSAPMVPQRHVNGPGLRALSGEENSG